MLRVLLNVKCLQLHAKFSNAIVLNDGVAAAVSLDIFD
jgi:hypothetical protein